MMPESEQHPNRDTQIALATLPTIPEEPPPTEIVVMASYVNLELGIPLLDYHGGKIWAGSAVLIATGAAALGFYEYQTNPEIQQNLQYLLPNIFAIFCCAPAAFPVAGFLWALYQDTVNY